MSPCGVEVACALTWTMSAAAEPGIGERFGDRAGGAASLGVGLGDVVAIGGQPGPAVDAVDACAAGPAMLARFEDEHSCTLAHDEAIAVRGHRDAMPRAGSSLRVDSARIAAKPAMVMGQMTASVPPATTTSARPSGSFARPRRSPRHRTRRR